jgi:formamidopyrimidine-DNA glycosylase
MPNRSLDDFAPETDGDATDSDVDAPDADAEATDTETTTAQSKSSEDDGETLATYRWTPTGTTCPQCGDTVEKTWLDGDEYVCADCKNW